MKAPSPVLHKWLLPLLADWFVVALCFALAANFASLWVWLAVVAALGVLQHRIAILGHDGAHYLACRPLWLNDLLTHLFCFWPLGGNLSRYRAFHFAHHNELGTDRDPEIPLRRGFMCLRTSRSGILLHTLFLLAGGGVVSLGMLWFFRPKRWTEWCGLPLFWALAVSLCLRFSLWLALLWPAAFVTSFTAVFWLRGLTEHFGTDDVHRLRLSWWQRWLFAPHNTWLHWEHHRRPAFPFWALASLRPTLDEPRVQEFTEVLDFYGKQGQ